MQPPTYAPNAQPNPQPNPPSPWWQDRLKVSLVAVGLLGIVAIVLLLVVLNARGGEGAVASPTPSATASSLEPTASPSLAEPSMTPTPSSTASASASASASPSGDPQAELAQGWTRIDTALNLRSGPGEETPVVRRLQASEVVWIGSEATNDGEYNWYYVTTLKGDGGYIASGPPDDPYASLISNRFVFTSCGQVAIAGKYGTVGGLRGARLDDFERATFELAMAMSTRGCVRYSMEDYQPKSRMTLEVHACGAPFQDASNFGLQPSTAGGVDDAWRVDETTVLPDLLLADGQITDDDGLTNQQKLLILGSRVSPPFACITAEVSQNASGNNKRQTFSSDMTACLVMTQLGSDAVSFAPAAGGDPVTFLKMGRQRLADVPLNEPRILQVSISFNTASELLGDC